MRSNAMVSVADDISRFKKAKDFASYIGLMPGENLLEINEGWYLSQKVAVKFLNGTYHGSDKSVDKNKQRKLIYIFSQTELYFPDIRQSFFQDQS